MEKHIVTSEQLVSRAMSLLDSGEDTTGICHACGETQSGVEPDAENYVCDTCGTARVCGAEQTIILLGGI